MSGDRRTNLGAQIPILPVVSSRTRIRGRGTRRTSVLDVGRYWLLDRGASAIRLALEHAAIGSGDEVLVPAFHCPSMIWPVVQARATPVFYGIGEDLRVSRAIIEEKITPRTRAVLLPHFFGQLQDMRAIRALCDERRMVLIEDCAHAFFGTDSGMPVGSLGHYAVASPRKFFPIAEGGLLVSRELDLSALKPLRSSLGQSFRTAYQMVDLAVSTGRLRSVAHLLWLAQQSRSRLRRWRTHDREKDAGGVRSVDGDGGQSVDTSVPRRACIATRVMMSALSHEAIIESRQRNYQRIVSRLVHARRVSIISLDLPASAAPYMVPLELHRPSAQFRTLRSAGIPVWRWEFSTRGVCKTTDRYADSLVQLPCHQDLDAREMDVICDVVLDL